MSFLTSPLRRSASTLPTLSARAFSNSSPSRIARLTMVGRLGTDPEPSETSNLIKYSVGVGSGPKDNRQTSWFRVAAFPAEGSGQREYIMKLTKGTLVYLEGDATMRTYDDADGKKQTALNLVQTKIEVLKRPTPTEDAATN